MEQNRSTAAGEQNHTPPIVNWAAVPGALQKWLQVRTYGQIISAALLIAVLACWVCGYSPTQQGMFVWLYAQKLAHAVAVYRLEVGAVTGCLFGLTLVAPKLRWLLNPFIGTGIVLFALSFVLHPEGVTKSAVVAKATKAEVVSEAAILPASYSNQSPVSPARAKPVGASAPVAKPKTKAPEKPLDLAQIQALWKEFTPSEKLELARPGELPTAQQVFLLAVVQGAKTRYSVKNSGGKVVKGDWTKVAALSAKLKEARIELR